ncbi:nuclear transport factor 2 family protein [Nocardia sp. NPDC051570]|uniref:nuclear transport factor 2 family protein n=1 Tax=Nocardia sp. NPDC051570 TaxID=3364324 RepID=UPI00379D8388
MAGTFSAHSLIEEFVARLSARDVDGVVAMFASYARVTMPYHPSGFPTDMIGDEQIREALTMLDSYERAPFTVRLATLEPLPHIRDGRIARMTQICSPLDQIISLGADIPGVNAPGLGAGPPS